MKGCRPSSSTPRRFANVLSKKHRVKKSTATVESQNTNLIARANRSSLDNPGTASLPSGRSTNCRARPARNGGK